MIVKNLSEIQKNIWILSDTREPIRVVDKRKNTYIATIFSTKKEKSILSIGWIFKNKISKDKKNINFSEARKEARDLYFKEKIWKR